VTARRTLLAAIAVAASTSLAACTTGPAGAESTSDGAASPSAMTGADTDAFPVTITHALGATTIEEAPTRVATLGWTDQDMVLSLGVVPVGATALTWGGNEAQSSDWFDTALDDMGAEPPVRYSDADGAPVEAIAELDPDVILATNSGITAEEYESLSRIAPVVAYPEAPWVTAWQDSLRMVGEALGRSDRAEEVVTETEKLIADTAAEHSELAGTTFVFAYLTTADLSTVGVYGREDPRVRILEQFGMESAPIVDEVVEDGAFYGTVSAERAATVESDTLLTYAESESDLQTFSDDPLLGQIPALAAGDAYAEVDKHVGLAITNPSPISLPYIIENFLPKVLQALPQA
jgi:iron complex transport system substrate-binding protein